MQRDARALRELADPALHVEALRWSGTHRHAELEESELINVAWQGRPGLVHVLDYRVPLEDLPYPSVVTVHGVPRLLHPEFCYFDEAFARRFGEDGLWGCGA